ncbi:YbcC family protein [Roseospira navarrensis]|uniref:Probable inorganic carbon transporter subunit DabA n=1 Tax=Roseospira navarrensis TaxID=140058 RepID=A0A7X1ZC57_9PROT|nr:DUF2309 domain-containing protein [Roseospira navarrensis]MQX35848.1 DUF2309 family protein [Roseospira navarrensis]
MSATAIASAAPLSSAAIPATARPDPAAVREAAARAGGRIAPVWPLKTFVAVNPWHGLHDHGFAQTAAVMDRAAGARLTMPRRFYLDALDAGRITMDDLAAALREAPATPGLPRDAAALVEATRATPEGPAPDPLPTVADVATSVTGEDWAGFVVERVSAWAADQFDEGQAPWSLAGRADGPYAAWRRMAVFDRTPEVMGLTGARGAVAARLPETADAALTEGVQRLGLGTEHLDAYFHRLLMSVGGWAAYARYKVWDKALYGKPDETLTEVLAVRLAWDVVLHACLGSRPGFDAAWDEARARAAAPAAPSAEQTVDVVLQTAYDLAWQRTLTDRLAGPRAAGAGATERPRVQAAFCIDVRSEVYRRALESLSPEVETIGFAGFFGFPIEYVPVGHTHGGPQCPVLLTPQVTVCETVTGATPDEDAEIHGLRLMRRRAGKAWKSFKMAAVSSFAFVETVGLAYLPKLVTDTFGWSRTVPHPSSDGLDDEVKARLAPNLDAGTLIGRPTGFTDETRTDMGQAMLTAMSMTEGFGRLVLLVGHGSTTVNNPHAAGLDCGACGGHTGEANARVAAGVLNDPAVRAGLRARGIDIPADTVFLGALHDTTTDALRIFDRETVPASHADDLAALDGWLERAARLTRAERAGILNLDPNAPVDAQVLARARDWSQVRPEWGLAGCAAFIAAPRSRTAGLDLGGRSFLHSYDWRRDEGYGTLELIMTAPMVVASWISLQYYASTVDNRVYGSGNKTLHNVVGTLGVLEGNGGDLRVGLPMQSIHDGERLIHDPLRLCVVIEAPIAAMNGIIETHPLVRDLLDNGWLFLFAMDETGAIAHRYEGGLRWRPVRDPTAGLRVAS